MSNLVVVFIILALLAVIVASLISGIRVLQEYERGVVFRLGRVLPRPKGPGLVFLLPFGMDRMYKVNLQDVTMNVPPQDVVTKDNVTMRVDAVIHIRVVDPVLAVSQAAQTTLRGILAQYELDTLFAEREQINRELRQVIATAAQAWGVEVLVVEIKDVDLPGGEQVNLVDIVTRYGKAKAKQAAQEQAHQGRGQKIFLCYRREDTKWPARAVHGSLSAKYGHEQVFRDVDSIPAGVRFSNWIKSEIGKSSVMIVLIGNAWSSAQDKAGRRRLDLPEDWVRQEIEAALRRNIPIIPVCVEGARMPSEGELPSSIAGLRAFQYAELADSRWDVDVGRLLDDIDKCTSSGDDR
jgi:hypothetical protein